MAKKKKSIGNRLPSQQDGLEHANGKLAPITTWEDVADSEDEFHLSRDKILLDEGPDMRRRRRQEEEDAFLEQSEEEILGYSSEEDDSNGVPQANTDVQSDDGFGEEQDEEEDIDAEGWGTSKRDYYNNDEVITQEDAKAEVEEAIRLQKKKLAKMKPADYGLDEVEWLGGAKDDTVKDGFTKQSKIGDRGFQGVVKEVLQPWIPTPEMGEEDHARILQSWYPEFEYLANELLALGPLLQSMEAQVRTTVIDDDHLLVQGSVTEIKRRALAAYVSTISMYFAMLACSAEGPGRAMDPEELHDHEIMDILVRTRETWLKVQGLIEIATTLPIPPTDLELSTTRTKRPLEDDTIDRERPLKRARKLEIPAKSVRERTQKEVTKAVAAEEHRNQERLRQQVQTEASLVQLSDLLPSVKPRPKNSAQPYTSQDSDDNSDFGEESHLTAASAAEKAKRKKSLRFYTSQIVQKSSKRQDAGRDAGGDADLPYRERLRDRQARLNAEAERRGRKLDSYGRGREVELGVEVEADVEQEKRENKQYGEDDDYYDMVAQRTKSRRDERKAYAAAVNAAKSNDSIVPYQIDADGKRAIGYTIEKNIGLAPKRKKEVRNPRVKKRMKFEEKKKKLGSMKAIYKGGEERGGYAGEKTGIKSHLVKSVKL